MRSDADLRTPSRTGARSAMDPNELQAKATTAAGPHQLVRHRRASLPRAATRASGKDDEAIRLRAN